MNFFPLFQPVSYSDPVRVFENFTHQEGAVFLDSAQLRTGCGRYSFIAVDPFLKLTGHMVDPWQMLAEKLAQFSLPLLPDLPPFQGGVAGFFSYDLYESLEKIRSSQQNDMQFPDLAIGFYDVVMAFDHELKRAWVFSSGFPEVEKNKREQRARERLEWMVGHAEPMSFSQKREPIGGNDIEISSNFTREQYCQAVQTVKEYILAGDIFEANISQRFTAELPKNSSYFDLYRSLRERSPAPFSAYLYFDETILASVSPERFLKVNDKKVEARPIKGTRSRGKNPQDDLQLANELMTSEKDRAENIMIVDLLRNDISRVCEPHSVHVPQLCGLESYPAVHHLVSVVTGKLRAEFNALDLLRVCFPGGSITGAPKVRAMEIIAEIEPTKRGPYCGSVGYIGFNGEMDMSIIIRTFVIKNNVVTFQAGGAVTIDSDPVDEYEETLTKANALRRTLHDFVN